MKISSSKNSGPILIVVLVAVLLFAVYYYIVLPKQDEADMMDNSVNSLNSEISTLNEQITSIQEEQSRESSNEFALRKKVPDNREIDELLLNIEEIEYVSGSRIQSISFNNYDSLVSASGLTDPNAVPTDEENPEGQPETSEETATDTTTDTSEETIETEEQVPTTPVSTIAVESLPANLKLVTFGVEVESPNYEKLQQFIKEIERLERVMHIDTISYALPGEENTFAEDASDIVSATIQVTTFYYE